MAHSYVHYGPEPGHPLVLVEAVGTDRRTSVSRKKNLTHTQQW